MSSEHNERDRLFQIYRSYVTHEDSLINQRLNRLLISHGVLLTACGALLEHIPSFPGKLERSFIIASVLGLAGAGIWLTFIQNDALKAAKHAISTLENKWNSESQHFHFTGQLPALTGGGHPDAHKHGQSSAKHLVYFVRTIWGVGLVLFLLYLASSLTLEYCRSTHH